MHALVNTSTIIKDGVVVNYAFYGAGPGKAVLPGRSQCHITVTPDASDWMASVGLAGGAAEGQPLTAFILPAPHDCGMSSLYKKERLCHAAAGQVARVFGASLPILDTFASAITQHLISPIVLDIAITQNDTISTLLAVGARCFESRPARIHKDLLAVAGDQADRSFFPHACTHPRHRVR